MDERRALSRHPFGSTSKEVMTQWTSDPLDKVGRAEELQIAPTRRDGTLQKPVTVWVVRHGDFPPLRRRFRTF